jgi:hypothetical protein
MSHVDWKSAEKIGVVQNTTGRREPGEHWILYYSERPGQIEAFDSLGFHPRRYGVQLPPYKISKYNNVRIQPSWSNKCSLYCLYMYYHRIKGKTFDEIVDSFVPGGKRINDIVVQRFADSQCWCH